MTTHDQQVASISRWIRTHSTREDMLEITEAIHYRSKVIAQMNFNAFRRGQQVRFVNAGIRPQYLMGKTGTIVEIRQSRILVALDCGPIGKFRSGKVLAHANGLEIIERTEVPV